MSARCRMTRSLVTMLLIVTAPSLALAREVPVLMGPVVDEAEVVEPAEWGRLNVLLRGAWALPPGRRVQLQILVVRTLEGEDIEGFAVRVFEKWKLGDKGKDNGVLIVVSKDDRRMRIETGYGAEGALTDAQAGRIIRNTLTPAFRDGHYGAGLYDASVQVLSALGALPEEGARSSPRPPRAPARLNLNAMLGVATLFLIPLALLMFPVFFIVVIILAIRRRGRPGSGPDADTSGSRLDFGSTGGDCGASSASSGGDWAGGGGQSGGGGASGSW